MAQSPRPVDSRWLRAVISRFEKPLTLYASRILGDVELARDVAQETFLRLCRQSPEAREKIEPHLAQWLYTVCRNGALNVRRKDRRMFPLSDTQMRVSTSGEPQPYETLEDKETTSEVLDALEQLPNNQREVLRLKFQHGMSYRQISAITGLTTSYVGYLIHAGIKNIREMLAQEGEARDTG